MDIPFLSNSLFPHSFVVHYLFLHLCNSPFRHPTIFEFSLVYISTLYNNGCCGAKYRRSGKEWISRYALVDSTVSSSRGQNT